jgi:hypothetical protein
MTVAIAALVVAMAGTALANKDAIVSALNKGEKKQTKKIADNRINLKAPELTVKSAGTANTATTATNAENLGGTPKTGFGSGVVMGSIGAALPGAFARSAFGPTNLCSTIIPCAKVQVPVASTLRDFRASGQANVTAGESLIYALEVNGTGIPLCEATTGACTNPGPIAIPAGAEIGLNLNGLGGIDGDEVFTHAYRLVPQ